MIRTRVGLGLSVITLIAAFGTFAARAQFNGPSSLGTTEINRPVTFTTDPAILYPGTRDVVLGYGDVIRFVSSPIRITRPPPASPPTATSCFP